MYGSASGESFESMINIRTVWNHFAKGRIWFFHFRHVRANRFDMELKDGASCPGDYLYRSGSFGWDVEYGMWGIFRVMKHSIRCKCKEMCGRLLRCMKWKSKTCLQSLVHSIPICYSEHRNNNSRSRWRIKIQEELMTWKFKKKWESRCWRRNIRM